MPSGRGSDLCGEIAIGAQGTAEQRSQALDVAGLGDHALADPDESLVGRIFLRDRQVVVASPALKRPTDNLAVPAVMRGAGDRITTWEVTVPTGRSRIAVDPVLRLSSLVMVRDAVRAGVGAGRLPVSLVSHDLAAGTLVHWGDIDGPEIALWTLYPSRRLLSARVSAFLDFMKEAFPMGTPDELAAFIGC